MVETLRLVLQPGIMRWGAQSARYKKKTPQGEVLLGYRMNVNLVAGASLGEVTMDFGDELTSRTGRAHLTAQNLLERNYAAI